MLPNHVPLVVLLGCLLCYISLYFIQSIGIFIKANSCLAVIPVFLHTTPYHEPSGTPVPEGRQQQASGRYVSPRWESVSLTACQKPNSTNFIAI